MSGGHAKTASGGRAGSAVLQPLCVPPWPAPNCRCHQQATCRAPGGEKHEEAESIRVGGLRGQAAGIMAPGSSSSLCHRCSHRDGSGLKREPPWGGRRGCLRASRPGATMSSAPHACFRGHLGILESGTFVGLGSVGVCPAGRGHGGRWWPHTCPRSRCDHPQCSPCLTPSATCCHPVSFLDSSPRGWHLWWVFSRVIPAPLRTATPHG